MVNFQPQVHHNQDAQSETAEIQPPLEYIGSPFPDDTSDEERRRLRLNLTGLEDTPEQRATIAVERERMEALVRGIHNDGEAVNLLRTSALAVGKLPDTHNYNLPA